MHDLHILHSYQIMCPYPEEHAIPHNNHDHDNAIPVVVVRNGAHKFDIRQIRNLRKRSAYTNTSISTNTI